MEQRVSPVPPLGAGRRSGEGISQVGQAFARHWRGDGRRNLCKNPPAWGWFPKRSRPPDGEAKGRSKGGLTTKILAATDRGGNLIRYLLLPGNAAEAPGLVPLTDGIATEGSVVIADKAYDSDSIRKSLAARKIMAVIPSKVNRRCPYPLDSVHYATRHRVENFFAKIKDFRRIATRYDKTDSSFAGMLDLVATVIAVRTGC